MVTHYGRPGTLTLIMVATLSVITVTTTYFLQAGRHAKHARTTSLKVRPNVAFMLSLTEATQGNLPKVT